MVFGDDLAALLGLAFALNRQLTVLTGNTVEPNRHDAAHRSVFAVIEVDATRIDQCVDSARQPGP